MNPTSFAAMMHLYSAKRQRIHDAIAKNRSECQRMVRRSRHYSIRRNKLLLVLILLLERSLSTSHRLIWSFQKNDRWWFHIVPQMTDCQFKENFRLERSTYSTLLRRIGPYLRKENSNYRLSVPVEKRLCCALYCLGSSSELRTIGNLFGIGKSTAAGILHDFCQVLVDLLFYRMIRFPSTQQEIEETINGFNSKSGYPMCVGSLDGTHISVKAPIGYEMDYYNYKKFHSVVMLATVNSNLEFTYVNVGAPGRCNDASVFSRSNLADVIQLPIYQNHFITVNQVKVQCHLIADSAFALDRTLMKPFPIRPDMPKENATFNYRLSKCRCSVERAFGLLKNRFRLLHKKLEFDLDNTKVIIKAAAVLHNICIANGDSFENDWDVPEKLYKKPACSATTFDGVDVRHAITQYFLLNPL